MATALKQVGRGSTRGARSRYSEFTYPKGKREFLEKLWTRLDNERSTFVSHWQDLADWTLPRRMRIDPSDRNKGDKRNRLIINNTAKYAHRTLESGLHAGLTSPARPWMKLETRDPALMKVPAVKQYLEEVTSRMLAVFAQTNLYNVLPTIYGNIGLFGSSAMAILPDSEDLFRAYNYPIGSFCLATNSRGVVNTFAREWEATVYQVVEQFGVIPGTTMIDWSTISKTVRNLWNDGDTEAPVRVRWMVLPNRDFNPDRVESRFKAFSSCYYEVGENGLGRDQQGTFLKESGFDTFPVMAPRWEVTDNDSYGTDSPGMTALGDTRQLQMEERKKGQAIAKGVDPSLVGPSSLRTQKTSLLPGDVTYQDVREGMIGLKPIHDVNPAWLQHLTFDLSGVEYRIKRAYFEDLFLMLQTLDPVRGVQPPTAREVEERHEEKLIALGPTLERTADELHDPAIDRVFLMMAAAKMLPEAPEELQGAALKVEYVSILQQAQKTIGVASSDRFLQTIIPLGEAFPETRYKLDPMQIVDDYADMLGARPLWVRPTEEARAMAEQAAQQERKIAEAQQAQLLAGAAKDASQASLDGNSALTRMLQAGGGQ
jgi:hypothetical protein